MNIAISTKNLSVSFGNQLIIENITLDVPRGQLTAVIGPNGAGKTTFLKCILGLLPYDGEIFISGMKVDEKKRPRIGYVPQRMELDRGLPITVFEFLALGVRARPVFLGIGKERRHHLGNLLERVKGSHLGGKQLSELSGGEFQRVLLAKALNGDPSILLLDEPVSGIDIRGEELFCDLLEDIQKETEKTVILVSHDLTVVTRHADFVLCLDKKLKCTGPPLEVMKTDNLFDLFGDHAGFYLHGDGHE